MNRLDIFDRARSRQTHDLQRKILQNRSLEYVKEKLGGEIIERDSSSVLTIRSTVPKHFKHGEIVLEGAYSLDSEMLNLLLPKTESSIINPSDLLFFDIETTGLSGGAGTNVFLIGFLRIMGEGIEIVQYFLSNLSSEPLFLYHLHEHLKSGSVLVSYNGKGYDYNVIKNRYILNGFPINDINPVHLDLLFTSRRIWKGIFPDFSLKTVERLALNYGRSDDIPGFRIPDVYFDYLRGRNVASDLYTVFFHNKLDLLSLLALLIKQIALLRSGKEMDGESVPGAGGPFNPASASDLFIRKGYSSEAKNLLKSHADRADVLKRLGLICKRQGEYRQALDFFKNMAERAIDIADYLFSSTEVAKLYEHVFKDIDGALTYAEKGLERLERYGYFYPEPCDQFEQERFLIEKRISRLKRKLSSY